MTIADELTAEVRERIAANTASRPSGGKGRWHRIDDQRSKCGAYRGGKGLLCADLSTVPLRERCLQCFPRVAR